MQLLSSEKESLFEITCIRFHVSEMNTLWKKAVSDIELFKYFLYFHHQFTSPLGLLSKLLKVHCVSNKKTHLNIIYIFNLLHYQAEIRMPVLWIPLQIPSFQKDIRTKKCIEILRLRQ